MNGHWSHGIFNATASAHYRLAEKFGQTNDSATRLLVIALLVFAAYYIGAALSFVLRVPSTRSSIIWAPNAVLLAALVATSPRTWWIWLTAALPAHLLAQARDTAPILLLLCPFLANVAQAVLAAAGLRRFTEAPHRLESLRDMAVFILVAVIAVPALVSFAAAWLFVLARWETEARFRNMADHAPVMIWTADSMGYRTYVNQRWTDFTALFVNRRSVFAGSIAFMSRIGSSAEIFLTGNQANEAFRREYRMRRCDGEYRWVIDSASPRFGATGNSSATSARSSTLQNTNGPRKRCARAKSAWRGLKSSHWSW